MRFPTQWELEHNISWEEESLRELKQRALHIGVDQDSILSALTEPDPKTSLIRLVQPAPSQTVVVDEYASMSVAELRDVALKIGVSKTQVIEALCENDPNVALVSLLKQKKRDSSMEKLSQWEARFWNMDVTALRAKAKEYGIAESSVNPAVTKTELVSMLLDYVHPKDPVDISPKRPTLPVSFDQDRKVTLMPPENAAKKTRPDATNAAHRTTFLTIFLFLFRNCDCLKKRNNHYQELVALHQLLLMNRRFLVLRESGSSCLKGETIHSFVWKIMDKVKRMTIMERERLAKIVVNEFRTRPRAPSQ